MQRASHHCLFARTALLALAAGGVSAWAQPLHIDVGSQFDERIYDIIEASAQAGGGFVAVGTINLGTARGQDFLIVRLDPAMNIIGAQAFGTPGTDVAFNVEQIPGTTDFMVVGETNGSQANFNVAALRVSNAGVVGWSRAYFGNPSAAEIVQDVARPISGVSLIMANDPSLTVAPTGVIVGRTRAGAPGNGQYGQIIKVNTLTGVPTRNVAYWDSGLGTANQTSTRVNFSDVKFWPVGTQLVLSGTIDNPDGTDRDILGTRIDISSMNPVWARRYQGPNTNAPSLEYGHSVALGGNDPSLAPGVVLVGYSNLNSQTRGVPQALRVNYNTGALGVSRIYPDMGGTQNVFYETSYASAYFVPWDPLNLQSVLIGGRIRNGFNSHWMALLRSDLSLQWAMRYDPASSQEAGEAHIPSRTTKQFVSAGWLQTTGSIGFGLADAHLVRTLQSGRFASTSPTRCDFKLPLMTLDRPMGQPTVALRPIDQVPEHIQWGTAIPVQEQRRELCPLPVGSSSTFSIVDLNDDGTLDLVDFFEFFAAYDAGDPRSDVNNDDSSDLEDFFTFYNEWDCQCE